jgi:hypothetical protein
MAAHAPALYAPFEIPDALFPEKRFSHAGVKSNIVIGLVPARIIGQKPE